MKKLLFSAILMMMAFVSVQAQVKIQSPSREIEVKMRECVLDGEDVYIEFLLINNGTKDIKDVFYASAAFPSTAHDDEGGTYKLEYGSLGSEPISSFSYSSKSVILPTGVPVKCKLVVSGVDSNASMFSLIKLNMYVGGSLRALSIRNLPINKD